MVSSPFTTGSFPEGVTVDPRGEYVYVANYNSDTVSSFAINVSTGALSSVAGSAGTTTATGPTCVAIDPALGIYAYTSNNVDGSVSGLQLNPHTGALTDVQGTKFTSGALPTCAVAVGNGAHATQIVQ
jgi:YVTN family beta-propeller protein